MENETKPEEQQWLQDLAARSWQLEMTISGAATFAVTFLPDLLDRGFDYYMDNLAPDTTPFSVAFPLLAYGFFKVMAWMLFGAFIIHLCLRALWVGAIGLHAAFPAGIQYDKLINATPAYKELAERHYGSLMDYIRRQDERCNRIFALAFTLAMGMAGIGLTYVLLFLGIQVLRQYVAEDQLNSWGSWFFVLFMMAFMVAGTAKYWLRYTGKYQDRVAKGMARVQLFVNRIGVPFFSRPVQFLNFTFMTNVRRALLRLGFVVYHRHDGGRHRGHGG